MTEFDTAEQNRLAEAQRRQEAAGIIVEAPVVPPNVGNYWGKLDPIKHFLPDGIQYIEYLPMTEGERAKYQTATQSKMTMNQNTRDSTMTFNVARDRRALLEVSVKGWNMLGPDGEPVAFKNSQFGFWKWYEQADPKLIEDLEKAVRKSNAWLQADMDEDEIQQEIERLNELLAEKREQALGEDSSSNK